MTLDYLYLTPHSPILLTDRRSNPVQLLADSPMSAACAVIDQNSISLISELITRTLAVDTHRDDRARMRTYYFGDTAKGSSTQAFWSAIAAEIAAYESALSLIQRVRQVQS